MLTFSLKELADRIGIEPRTIRSYVEKGLLPGPEGAGRAARYGEHHLNRLRVIKVLKNQQGWTLEDIRRRLLGMIEREIDELAEALSSEEESWLPDLDRLPQSAPDFVQKVQMLRSSVQTQMFEARVDSAHGEALKIAEEHEVAAHEDPWSSLAASPSLLIEQRLPHERPRSRRTKATLSYEIEITPDVSLVVKGLAAHNPESDKKLQRFEALAERIRQLLMERGEGDC